MNWRENWGWGIDVKDRREESEEASDVIIF